MKHDLSYIKATRSTILKAANEFHNEKRFSFSQSLHDTIKYTVILCVFVTFVVLEAILVLD